MPLNVFMKRTSALNLPKHIYQRYETIVKKCESCQKSKPAPERSKVTGMRAMHFGDLIFVDHTDINVDDSHYLCLIIVDAASIFKNLSARNKN